MDLSLKKVFLKSIYKSLSMLINLSEYVYIKLKYVKYNYKSILISIFEEEDNSTLHISKNKIINQNKRIDSILKWFSSIFGVIEGDIVAVIVNKAHAFSVYFRNKLPRLFKRERTSFLVSSICVYFFMFFYFT